MSRNLMLEGYIAERAFNTPLLLEEGKARAIANVLERRFGMHGGGMVNPAQVIQRRNELPQAMSFENIAVIDVTGTLVHRGSFADAESGLLSYTDLKTQLIESANNDMIKVIVLDVDSGGGEVDGNFEVARLVRRINDNVKPVIAIANGMAYSGAFSIGVAAGKFFMIETGGVGSVGVITQHIDYSKQNEMIGIKITNIIAGERKAEFSPDFPLSVEAKNMLQEKVNRTYEIFVNHVAEMRGIQAKAIINTQAALIFGEDAIKIDFIDGIIAFDDLIEGLVNADFPAGLVETKQRIDAMFLKKEKANTEPKKEEEIDNTSEADPVPEPEVGNDPAPAPEPETKESAEIDPVERSAMIVEICEKAGFTNKAPFFIRTGKSVDEVRTEVSGYTQIRQACKLAGKSDKADGFIASGKSLKVVQDELVAELEAEQASSDVSNKPNPDQVKSEIATAGKNVILADAEARRQKAEAAKTKQGV